MIKINCLLRGPLVTQEAQSKHASVEKLSLNARMNKNVIV